MEQYLHAIIVALFGGLVWFVKAKMASNDAKHIKHFESIGQIREAAAALIQKLHDHTKVDDDRFGRIEKMLDESRADIKTILVKVSQKRD